MIVIVLVTLGGGIVLCAHIVLLLAVGGGCARVALGEVAGAQLLVAREGARGLAAQLALVLAPLEHKLASGSE